MCKTEEDIDDELFDRHYLDENNIEKLNKCLDACGLQRFTDENLKFLIEYYKVLIIVNIIIIITITTKEDISKLIC